MTTRRSVFGVLAIAAVLLCGLLSLADPLGGDQSLFLIGSHAMHNGAVLYKDFWDIKQPGIYAFYFLATMIGGYSAVSVHVTELAYMVAFAVVLIVAMRRSRSFSSVAAIVPLAAIGFYYLATGSFEQIQIETLVGLPLFVAIWLFYEGTAALGSARRAVLFAGAGGAAAAVISLKLMFLPIVVIALCTVLFSAAVRRSLAMSGMLLALTATTLGFLIPLIAIGWSFAAHGALDAALRTWFVIPPRIVAEVPYAHEPVSVLMGGIRWFVHRFFGIFILAAVGLYYVIKRKPDLLALGLVAWLVAGTAVIVLQVTSWFQYHWLLLSVPLGAFAAVGARELWEHIRSQSAAVATRWTAVGILIIAGGLMPAVLAIHKLRTLAANDFALTPTARERYRAAESPVYAGCRQDAALIPPRGAQLYVIGNPTYYIVTDRLQSVAINGSSVRLLLRDQWVELERELDDSSPQFIYISHAVSVPSRSFEEFFADRYGLRSRGTLGDVFARR